MDEVFKRDILLGFGALIVLCQFSKNLQKDSEQIFRNLEELIKRKESDGLGVVSVGIATLRIYLDRLKTLVKINQTFELHVEAVMIFDLVYKAFQH